MALIYQTPSINNDNEIHTGLPVKNNYLFPESNNTNLIQYDNEGLRFVTYASTARDIAEFVYQLISNGEISIIDMTAGLGGDTLAYGLYTGDKVKKIYAIELDKFRYKCLQNNVKVYDLQQKITCVNMNAFDFVTKSVKFLKTKNIIFSLDPPWGGDDYLKNSEILDLWLYNEHNEKISIYNIIDNIRELYKDFNIIIVLKLPNNFKFSDDIISSHGWPGFIRLHFHKNIQTIILQKK